MSNNPQRPLRCVAVRRADCFSPNSVEADRAILRAAADRLAPLLGIEPADITMIDEDHTGSMPQPDVCLSMARCTDTLARLATWEQGGCTVVNRAPGVTACQRATLDRLMRRHHVPMPPQTGTHGYWLKRGDAAAQDRADVVFCPDEAALREARQAFAQRGITLTVTSAHMVGDLVKFYGVADRFFALFYPSDDGISKFGDEQRNGQAHHYAFCRADLQREAARLSRLTGVDVYGGDAIVDSEGRFYIIDFNDWPSFSRCRPEAAEAIATLVAEKVRA